MPRPIATSPALPSPRDDLTRRCLAARRVLLMLGGVLVAGVIGAGAKTFTDDARSTSDSAAPGAAANLATADEAPPSEGPVSGPLSPEDSLRHLQVDDGLVVELVAAEPDVVDPTFIAFDDDGRLWVIELRDYPNGPDDGQPPRSRIRILTDDDHDGRFGSPKTFAEGLLFPTSLMFWEGGVLATVNGELVHFVDEDGDDVADRRTTWFAGFARENPQLRCNHPTLGPDGWIYVANGLRGGKVVAVRDDWAGRQPPLELGARDFRFNPRTGECTTASGFGQYGLTFDDAGRRFLCSNRNPCMHVVFEEADLQRNPAIAVPQIHVDVVAAAENSQLTPISRAWTTSTLHANQFTAACGLEVYRGDALPRAYYGNAMTCDPTGNLVHREVLSVQGATFSGRNPQPGREFLASRDSWFRPVDLEVGPDGALYVADMYRAVIEHPEYMPQELKTRPDLRLGDDRGRIYRITQRGDAGAPKRAQPKLDAAAPAELVALLDHPNGWHRDAAFRTIAGSHDSAMLSLLLARATDPAATPLARPLALKLLAIRDELPQEVLWRAADALHAAEGDPQAVDVLAQLLARRVPGDPRLAVWLQQQAERGWPAGTRFQLALSVAALPEEAPRAATLLQLLRDNDTDEWLSTAAALAAGEEIAALAQGLLREAAGGPESQQSSRRASVILLVRVVGERRRADELAQVFVGLQAGALSAPDSAMSWQAEILGAMGAGVSSRGGDAAEELAAAARAAGFPWDELLRSAADLVAREVALAEEAAAAAADGAEEGSLNDEVAATTGGSLDDALSGLQILEFAPWEDSRELLTRASQSASPLLAEAAVKTVARFTHPDVAEALLEGFRSRTPSLRRVILAAMFSDQRRIARLLDAIEQGQLPVAELDVVRQQQLQQLGDPELRGRAEQLLAASAPADRSEVLADYQPALERKGDPHRGREVFRRVCAQCHKIGDLGVNVAPDIADSRDRLPAQLLVGILDPNRAIDGGYFSFTAATRSGEIHTGVISAETSTAITLRQPEGKTVTLLRSELEQLQSNGVSLMPVGLEKNVSVEEMADLISFIKNWRYLDGAAPPEVIR